MRRVRRSALFLPPLVVPGARLVARQTEALSGQFEGHGVVDLAGCLRCPSQPCRTSGIAPENLTGDMCPVEALTTDDSTGLILVEQDCIGCGICGARCPVGAFGSSVDGRLFTNPVPPQLEVVEASDDEFAKWIETATASTVTSSSDRAAFVNRGMAAAAPLLGRHFYPLVQSLFRAIGVPATMSNHGDTSNRVDLFLTDPVDPIPVEIKSRTEVDTINVKSVQQALENKLTVARQTGASSLSASSTLVVGYEYPPVRSGISELIDNIESAFGIRIGLVSLRRLYELVLTVNIDGQSFDRHRLANLKGPL